ncbi:CoA-binding protein [Cognatishimia sp. WU-CL00825]|uniref:CoA-binding protein n=1 Tax=Cognatishimia sp. WU-CL00825 TaxID=3127658 RepID=UPI00310B2FDD
MENYSDDDLRDVFSQTRTIAVVGFSMNPSRASHYVAKYLVAQGYNVIPVNPGHAGTTVFGTTIRATLADIDEPVDMVDVFRRSEAVPEVVEQALTHLKGLKTIWMQLGVTHEAAAKKARAAGVTVVMNRCPKIEYPRLMLGI